MVIRGRLARPSFFLPNSSSAWFTDRYASVLHFPRPKRGQREPNPPIRFFSSSSLPCLLAFTSHSTEECFSSFSVVSAQQFQLRRRGRILIIVESRTISDWTTQFRLVMKRKHSAVDGTSKGIFQRNKKIRKIKKYETNELLIPRARSSLVPTR